MKSIDLHIEGMTCAACSSRIERVLNKLPGVHAEVSLLEHRARISGLDSDAAIAAIRRAGYDAWPARTPKGGAGSTTSSKTRQGLQQFRLVASAIGLSMMSVEMLGMLTGHHGIVPVVMQWCVATLMQTIVAWPFYRQAWRAARVGAASMETLISIGTLAAYGWSCVTTLNMVWGSVEPGPSPVHTGALYFETSVVVLAMLTLGRAIEGHARQQALAAIAQLTRLDPTPVQAQQPDGQWEWVHPERVMAGQEIRLAPNTEVALDGVITQGSTEVDESSLTGESHPVRKVIGETLYAGCTNLTGVVTVKVSAPWNASRRAKMGDRILTALASRAPIAAAADRVASVFVPAILAIALLTFVIMIALTHDVERALVHAIAVLVIACPCALGLATPAAIASGLARAAQHGWLFASADALQRAAEIRHVVFDKTGTLSSGRPVVLATTSPHAWPEWLACATATERGIEHPLAGALLSYAAGRPLPDVHEVHVHPGFGVSAQCRVTGQGTPIQVRVGQPGWISAAPPDLKTQHPDASAIDVECNGVWSGRIWLVDVPRPEARAALGVLTDHGIGFEVLSGDRGPAVQRLANALGIGHIHAQQTPEQKAERLEAYAAEHRPTAMVGDGINDASAMAHAHLGVAMASGAGLTLETADVTISSASPLMGVAQSLLLARDVMRRVKENLFFAFAFNTLAIPLAAFGKLSPAIAGAAMAISSALVMINAARLLRWSPRPPAHH